MKKILVLILLGITTAILPMSFYSDVKVDAVESVPTKSTVTEIVWNLNGRTVIGSGSYEIPFSELEYFASLIPTESYNVDVSGRYKFYIDDVEVHQNGAHNGYTEYTTIITKNIKNDSSGFFKIYNNEDTNSIFEISWESGEGLWVKPTSLTNSSFINTFKIVFDVPIEVPNPNVVFMDGNVEYAVNEVSYNSAVTMPTNLTKIDHHFVGWYCDSYFIEPFNESTLITTPTILYGKWVLSDKPNPEINYDEIEIKFFTNGTVTSGTYSKLYNLLYAKGELEPVDNYQIFEDYIVRFKDKYYLDDLSMKHYVSEHYIAFYIESDLLNETYHVFVLPNDTWLNNDVMDDLIVGGDTIAIMYEATKYNVTFMNGEVVFEEMEVGFNKAIVPPTSPTKAGFVFAGWFKDEDFIEGWKMSDLVTEDITLYAKFVPAGSGGSAVIPDDINNSIEDIIIYSIIALVVIVGLVVIIKKKR